MNKQNKELEAIAAHLLDLYQIATFTFSVPHSYTKFRSILSLKQKTSARNLIETGTYLGVTTKRCASHFDKIYTIELDQDIAEQAKKHLSGNKNIEVIQGDAVAILPKVFLKDEDKDVLIFLDGHFSGGDTACGDLPEPAIEELKALSPFRSQIAGIIIDDFRLFGTEPGFPSKSEIFKAIEEYFPGFGVSVALDQILIFREIAV
jgi:Ribosomal RNA adenine dimethylase